jgi:hypothetical protein
VFGPRVLLCLRLQMELPGKFTHTTLTLTLTEQQAISTIVFLLLQATIEKYTNEITKRGELTAYVRLDRSRSLKGAPREEMVGT